jgi:hypothetical protein
VLTLAVVSKLTLPVLGCADCNISLPASTLDAVHQPHKLVKSTCGPDAGDTLNSNLFKILWISDSSVAVCIQQYNLISYAVHCSHDSMLGMCIRYILRTFQ